MMRNLSNRGTLAAHSPARVDIQLYFEALQARYHPADNPRGKFPMNVAENNLCWEILRDKIASVMQQEIPEWVAGYTNPAGRDSFREVAASYLSTFLFGHAVKKETLVFSAGLTSVIDITAFLLANPGEVAIIPAPSYPVYTADLGVKSAIKRFDLQTHTALTELKNGIPLTTSLLNDALHQVKAEGNTCSMLILTSPDNPTGGIYTAQQLEEIADWCIKHEIHLVVNEIYGLTLINTKHPKLDGEYNKPLSFQSFATIMAQRKNPYLHLWYSVSKDLGLSGFRVGMVHSYNEDFIAAYTNVNMTHSVSNLTQWVLQEVLKDHPFVKTYMHNMQERLTEAYVQVVQTLKSLSIPYAPAYGSVFVWMDLSELLDAQSRQPEHDLWMEIYEVAGLLLTPTNGFGHAYKGCYRMVITYLSTNELEVAMERFAAFVGSKRR